MDACMIHPYEKVTTPETIRAAASTLRAKAVSLSGAIAMGTLGLVSPGNPVIPAVPTPVVLTVEYGAIYVPIYSPVTNGTAQMSILVSDEFEDLVWEISPTEFHYLQLHPAFSPEEREVAQHPWGRPLRASGDVVAAHPLVDI